jgi:hypothetical protein
MADNTPLNPGTGGDVIASDDIGGVKYQRNKLIHGADGVNDGDVSTSNPLPVTLGLTDTQLRANPVPVSGAFFQATQPVSFTWAGLTDAQLRASAVPVSFTWSGLTNAELRATPVPVSASALPLPSGAATETTVAALQALLTTLASTIQNHNGVFVDGSPGQVMLGKRRDSDSTLVADGDLNTFNMDEEGRLKVASKPASYPDITGDITAIQATIGTPVAGGTVAGDVSRASNIMVFCTGTFAGVNCTFEGSMEASGDTNWFAVQALRSNANTIELTTGVLAAQPAYAWELSVNALRRFRVRCTARTSGTQSWRFVQGTYATEPIPAAQISGTQPVSFTQPAQVAGTALMGDVGLQVRANATGAASIHHIVSAATTNVAQIKATAGRVYGYCLSNTTASWRYVKLHNVASATAGAAVAMTIGLPPNGKAECYMGQGIGFATAISRSIVTGSADTDATAVAAGDVLGDIFFA